MANKRSLEIKYDYRFQVDIDYNKFQLNRYNTGTFACRDFHFKIGCDKGTDRYTNNSENALTFEITEL